MRIDVVLLLLVFPAIAFTLAAVLGAYVSRDRGTMIPHQDQVVDS